ncbi:hypothetical protein RvY_00127 [Ramazzottius varieornatus]|uniref:Uncharacterized protein n=1 Tax=Ramazzottius varieornatus TaxID=947166 RepID=A0A1D1UFU4_RAMVA|nr:hypothetical protein RvY_00127 [Ramazzottius varieornatus]
MPTACRNAYIVQKSGGAHECEDRSHLYCWHQCMLENSSVEGGLVTEDCACNADFGQNITELSLPWQCYNPDGRDCSWYRDCLERKHPCSGDHASYAIDYGEKFCLMYNDRFELFSAEAQQWIDGVRKCLQVALVPLIRPYYSGSCEDIKRQAFASHAPCYLRPGYGAPSICGLSCSDWMTAFWTVKGSLVTDFFGTLTGMVKVARGCAGYALECGWRSYKNTVSLALRFF